MDKQTSKINELLAKLGMSGLEGPPDEKSSDNLVLGADYFVDPKTGKFVVYYRKAVLEDGGGLGTMFWIVSIDKNGNVAENEHVERGILWQDYFKNLKKITKDEFFRKYKKRG